MPARTEGHHEESRFVPYKDIGLRSGTLVIPGGEGPLHPSWLAPLDAVTSAVAGNPRFRFFDPSDFMIMNQWLRHGRPTLVLYKHWYTRRYLNLDAAGNAYRYLSPKDIFTRTSNGRYLPHRDLCNAIDHLRLWELPWMKASLEHERRGLDFEDAWRLHPRFAGHAA